MKVLFTVLLAMLYANFTSAQILKEENFNYTVDSSLTNQASWIRYNSNGVQPAKIIAGGLTFPNYNYTDTDGKAVKLNPSNQGTEDAYTNLSSSVSSGTFYLSFLVKVDKTTPATNISPLEFLSLSSSSRLVIRSRLCAIETSTTAYKFRLIWGNTSSQFSETSTSYTYGTTYLVVLKYNKIDGADNDKNSLYVFNTTAPLTEPTSAVIAPFGYTNEIDPSSVNLVQLGPSSTSTTTTPQNITIDGMAAAYTWGDIFAKGDTITFSAADTASLKRGNLGFLHSINTTAPLDSFVTLIKPKIWRVGRYNDPFNLYTRLKNNLGVQKQILVLSDFRTIQPWRNIYLTKGYGVMTDSLIKYTQSRGLDYEFDIFNEPNDSLKNDFSGFMKRIWKPAYLAIKANSPNAKIHGPSTGINTLANPLQDSLLIFKFIDSTAISNTLPDYMNWHFQSGYSIADWQIPYAEAIKTRVALNGKTISGIVVGETIRPGNERNTSPGVLADVFATAEIGNITQIHAAWSSSRVYGISTSQVPVLDGILTDSTGTGRRGAWWTYRFFAQTDGRRIKCQNTSSGSANLVGIAFRNTGKQVVRAIVGTRDTKSKQQNSHIAFSDLQAVPYVTDLGKVHVKVWYNYQTKFDVGYFGADSLPKIIDADYEIINNKIDIKLTIDQWDAVLIELSKPTVHTVLSTGSSASPNIIAYKTSDIKAQLNWTFSETANSSYYIIEKATNINSFKQIAKINSNGLNANTPYTIFDNEPEIGINYYRSKLYDNNGTLQASSNIATLQFDNLNQAEVSIFPNPSTGLVNIYLKGYPDPLAEVQILNMMGKVVHKESIILKEGQNTYPLTIAQKLNSGIYIVNIKSKNSEHSQKLFIL
jgi:hypothetical protein